MLGFLAKLFAGPLIDAVVGVFNSYQSKKITELELRSKLNDAILSTFSDVAKTQADVIKAEINGEDWLQRNWRPLVAITFATIPIFYAIILPIAVGWFHFPPVRVGDDLLSWIMDVVKICLGGYIGGRTVEKIVSTMKG